MARGGATFRLKDDSKILGINSPKKSVGGPYVVVCKNLEERWAIVAMDWDEEPRLGIRWFWGSNGHPSVRGYPTWFVIPPTLSKILVGSPLAHEYSGRLEEYLDGKISGPDLASS